MECPVCGSTNIKEKGGFVGGLIYYQCLDCGYVWPAKKEKKK